MTAPTDQADDGLDVEEEAGEMLEALLQPIADLVHSAKHTGAVMLRMLLRREFQRGYAAGRRATFVEDHGPVCPADPPLGRALRDRIHDDRPIRLGRPS